MSDVKKIVEKLYQLKYVHGLYFVETNKGGQIPAALTSGYTDPKTANEAIELYTAGCFKPSTKKAQVKKIK